MQKKSQKRTVSGPSLLSLIYKKCGSENVFNTRLVILCDINFERNFYSIEMGHLQ